MKNRKQFTFALASFLLATVALGAQGGIGYWKGFIAPKFGSPALVEQTNPNGYAILGLKNDTPLEFQIGVGGSTTPVGFRDRLFIYPPIGNGAPFSVDNAMNPNVYIGGDTTVSPTITLGWDVIGVGGGQAADADTYMKFKAGTTGRVPIKLSSGPLKTTPVAGSIEFLDGAFYQTIDTSTNGRTFDDGWNYFRLTGSGSGITTIADFFGANSAIPLVASGVYEVEWNAYFSQATAGTATWTVTTATTALANITGEYVCSNIAGIQAVGAPQTAGINTTASSATAFPATGSEATGVTHYCRVRVMLTAGAGASNTRLRLTMSAGTATPLINSYFRARRLPGVNTGTFVP